MDTDHLSLSTIYIISFMTYAVIATLLYSYVRLTTKTLTNRTVRKRSVAEISLNSIAAMSVAFLLIIIIQLLGNYSFGVLEMLIVLLVLILSLEILVEVINKKLEPFRIIITKPILRLLNSISTANSSDTKHTTSGITETKEEVEDLVYREVELGNLDSDDKEMIRSILQLNDTTVREIMVPRLDMTAVDIKSGLNHMIQSVIESGHSRIPVYQETPDQIVGIIHSHDLLSIKQRNENESETNLHDYIRPAHFVPEAKLIDDLLEDLQDNAIQMAIVVDEFGGTEGLVTMEDLLEEIVGEIEDEFTKNTNPEIVPLQNGEFIVSAGTSVDDISKMINIDINEFGIDTIGGYVFQQLGRMPILGDTIESDTSTIQVISVLGRRLRRLRISNKSNDEVTN
jgi:putative hemolysin